jgi:hypothetical protein
MRILPTFISLFISICHLNEGIWGFSLLFSSFPTSQHVVLLFSC